jgi:WD40 repeat protein
VKNTEENKSLIPSDAKSIDSFISSISQRGLEIISDIEVLQVLDRIASSNVSGLEEYAIIGKGGLKDLFWLSDGGGIAITSKRGIAFHNEITLEESHFLEIPNTCATISHDGSLLVTVSKENDLKVWQISDCSIFRTIGGFSEKIKSISISSDNSLLAVGSEDCTVSLWNVDNGNLINKFKGYTDNIFHMTFSPDSTFLAIGVYSHIYVIHVSSGRLLCCLIDIPRIKSISFSPDSRILTSCAEDKSIRVWKISDGSLLRTIDVNLVGKHNFVINIEISPNGSTIAAIGSSGGNISLWQISNGHQVGNIASNKENLDRISFSPDARFLASSKRNRTVQIFRVQDSNLQSEIEGNSCSIGSVSFSPNSKLVAIGTWESGIKICRVKDGLIINQLKGHDCRPVETVAFSPDGTQLASGGYDGDIIIWDVNIGCHLMKLRGHSDWVRSIKYSPDGELIASSSWDSTIRIWRAFDGKIIRTIKAYRESGESIAFSPDGKKLASVSWGEGTKIWDVEDWKLDYSISEHSPTYYVAISNKGEIIATSSIDGLVRLWRVSDGSFIKQMKGIKNHGPIEFSLDDELMIKGTIEGHIGIYRISDGNCVNTLYGHMDRVTSLSMSPSGRFLASGGMDGTVRLWGINSKKLVTSQ